MVEIDILNVGTVRNELKEVTLGHKDGDLAISGKWGDRPGFGEIVSELVIDDEYAECLEGVEEFSHVLVLYWTHKVDESGRALRKVHPGGQQKFPEVGIFATRSPVRPNPICLTSVEVVERQGNVLKVKGLDAIDGSPIIDIKPPHPHFDIPPNVKLSAWMDDLLEDLSGKS